MFCKDAHKYTASMFTFIWWSSWGRIFDMTDHSLVKLLAIWSIGFFRQLWTIPSLSFLLANIVFTKNKSFSCFAFHRSFGKRLKGDLEVVELI